MFGPLEDWLRDNPHDGVFMGLRRDESVKWKDDSQITELHIRKVRSTDPGVIVEVYYYAAEEAADATARDCASRAALERLRIAIVLTCYACEDQCCTDCRMHDLAKMANAAALASPSPAADAVRMALRAMVATCPTDKCGGYSWDDCRDRCAVGNAIAALQAHFPGLCGEEG